jgi:hypothetical protein
MEQHQNIQTIEHATHTNRLARLAALCAVSLMGSVLAPADAEATSRPSAPDLAENADGICTVTDNNYVRSTATSAADLVIVQSVERTTGKWVTVASAKNVKKGQVLPAPGATIQKLDESGPGQARVRTLAKTGKTWSTSDMCLYWWGA